MGVFFYLFSSQVYADSLIADRPGETEMPNIVSKGNVQLEGGIKFERETSRAGPNTSTFFFPQLLLRIGLSSFMEIRLAADGFIFKNRSRISNKSAGSDFELGGKLRFTDQNGLWPATGLLVNINFPTGGREFTSNGIDPSGTLLSSWELSEQLSVIANLGFSGPTQGFENTQRIFEVRPALSLDFAVTPAITVFGEYFSVIKSEGKKDRHSIDAGLAYLVNDDLQLDLSAGIGLTSITPDYFIKFGFAWRLPVH